MNKPSEYPANTIYVNATIAPDGKTPLVFWHYCGHEGTLTLLEARARAEALLMAAAIAETEARVAVKLTGIDDPKLKGFGRTKEREKAENDFKVMRGFMRAVRFPLPEEITPIFGQRTHLPLVNIDCYGEPIQAETSTVRDHAFGLLECAEAAESDRFFYYFLAKEAGLKMEDVNKMLQSFAMFRRRVQLQDLLDKS